MMSECSPLGYICNGSPAKLRESVRDRLNTLEAVTIARIQLGMWAGATRGRMKSHRRERRHGYNRNLIFTR
jgi:hypothetical protein